MTETLTRRRPRRPISASTGVQEPMHPIVQGVRLASPLTNVLNSLRDVARMKQYRIIGRLSRLQIVRAEEAKTIDFRKDGPVLAFANGSEQLIVTSEWKGIPPKWNDTDQFCSECLSTCDVCAGSGVKACEAFKCGGAGKKRQPETVCPACLGSAEGKRKNDCATCRGAGMVVQLVDCEVCKGTGKAPCSLCRGTGKRPTGISGGETDYRKPACATCSGSKFAHTEIPQPIEQFVNAQLEGGILAIGPIVRFAVESVGGEGSPPLVYDVNPDANGQYLVILIEPKTNGAFMVGGILTCRTR